MTLPRQRIYLAGKVSPNCRRHDIVKTLRDHGPDPDHADNAWPMLEGAIFEKHDYTGPFFVSCDHGCWHGTNDHGMGAISSLACGESSGVAQTRVAQLCERAIRRSTLLFAWINDSDAYGTLVEIGVARGAGVPVVVACPKEIIRKRGTGVIPVPSESLLHQQWFAFSAACMVSTHESAKVALGFFLRELSDESCPRHGCIL